MAKAFRKIFIETPVAIASNGLNRAPKRRVGAAYRQRPLRPSTPLVAACRGYRRRAYLAGAHKAAGRGR